MTVKKTEIVFEGENMLLNDNSIDIDGVLDKAEDVVRKHAGEAGVKEMYDPSGIGPFVRIKRVVLELEIGYAEGDEP